MKPCLAVVLDGFDDPRCSPQVWERLLHRGDTDGADLTWCWQRNWWKTFGSGRLLLVAAQRGSEVLAIAPFFTAGRMIFNLCPENHLDFVGDIGNAQVLDALLTRAMDEVPDFEGFRLYFVPDVSRTGPRLRAAAGRIGLACYAETEIPSPVMDIAAAAELARSAARKKSLIRHENYFRRAGALEVHHWRDPDAIAPQLDAFFEQHVRRRRATRQPSLFEQPRQREYYRRILRVVGPSGWLRFTRVDWNGVPIAYHFGHSYRGRYSLGIPSFEIDLATYSPGEVLLRQLILAAIDEGSDSFDFGLGDEAYKYRFATRIPQLTTWGMYPHSEPTHRSGAA